MTTNHDSRKRGSSRARGFDEILVCWVVLTVLAGKLGARSVFQLFSEKRFVRFLVAPACTFYIARRPMTRVKYDSRHV